VHCFAPAPLEWVNQRWQPWAIPPSLAATAAFKAFAATVRRCETAQALEATGRSAWRVPMDHEFRPPLVTLH